MPNGGSSGREWMRRGMSGVNHRRAPRMDRRRVSERSRATRTLAIFRLALSYWRDSRRIERARRSLDTAAFADREAGIYREGGVRFRETALRLGGLIIKVGQFLSARTDVLPLAFTRELSQLQDQVPPAPWSQVRPLLEAEWGRPVEEMLASIDPEPVAAASLGQVYRARLSDGREVAVKVQRPGIERLAAIDLGALRIVMRVVDRTTRVGRRINAVRLFEEFETLVGQELNYQQEVRNLERFGANFRDEPQVRVPAPITALARRRVFAMDYATGVKLTDPEGIRSLGLDPRELGDILIRAYLKQIAVDGFVQIDPHAGNFFADPEGRVIFLDFGMVGEIPAGDLRAVGALLRGVLAKDTDAVLTAIDDLGFVRPGTPARVMRGAIQFLLERLSGTPLEPGPEMDRAVAQFQDFLYHEPLQFPARYMFLGRAIGMLFGLVSGLNPEIDWMEVLKREALPLIAAVQRGDLPEWLSGLVRTGAGLLGTQAQGLVEGAVGAGWTSLSGWLKVPGRARRILELLEQGRLGTEPELTGVMRKLDRLADLAQARLALSWALVWALGGAAARRVWPRAEWLVGISALLVLWQLFGAWRMGRRRPQRR